MPTIDIDRDAAHDAAQRELGKPIYPKASLTERLFDWLDELLYTTGGDGASSVPGGWFTLTVLLILLVVAVVVAIRIAMRTMRTNRGGGYALFGENELSAAQHRATAEQYAAQAIGPRPSAIASEPSPASSRRRGYSTPVPGRTATELARDAGKAIPGLSAELRRAAVAFNDVTYGERPGTEAGYRMIADLDDHLSSRPAGADAAATARPPTLGGGAMTDSEPTDSAVGPTVAQRWRTARWVVLALVVITRRHSDHLSDRATARRPDGSGVHVARRRPRAGIPAARPRRRRRRGRDVADVERAARPDTLLVVPQTSTWSTTTCCAGWPTFPATGCWSNHVAHPGGTGARDPPRGTRSPSAAPSPIATCAKPTAPGEFSSA